MRMLYCPFRSPFKASSRLPGKAPRSLSSTAASRRSNLSRAARSIPKNAFTRLPDAKSLVRLSRYLTITFQNYQIVTHYVKHNTSEGYPRKMPNNALARTKSCSTTAISILWARWCLRITLISSHSPKEVSALARCPSPAYSRLPSATQSLRR